MDMYEQWHIARASVGKRPRRNWSRSEKLAIVLKTCWPCTSVSGVAREHGIPASLLFEWRKLYRQGVLSPAHSFEARVPSQQST